jgi:NarL family two-component system response regulator LiaR
LEWLCFLRRCSRFHSATTLHPAANYMSVRVALIIDDTASRKGIVRSLRQAGGYEVCGTYHNGKEAQRELPSLRPDIVIVDLGLNDGSGVECIRSVKNEFPSMDFVAIGHHADTDTSLRALQSGANAVVPKHQSTERIHEARRILEHIRTFPVISAQTHSLSQREMQVVRCMDMGLSYREIADTLYISIETVRRHAHNLYRKLNVRNRTEALSVLRELKTSGAKI